MAFILLHGTLHVTIYEAADLEHDHSAGGFFNKIIGGLTGDTATKLYATVDLESTRVGRTRMVGKHEPWNESFHIYCAHNVANVVITVKDDKAIGASLLGRARIPVSDLLNGEEVENWFELYKDDGDRAGDSKVRVKLHFHDVATDPCFGRGLRDGTRFKGVPFTFCQQRKGCKVTLYQDAHMTDNFLPEIHLAGGKKHAETRCWEDVFEALINAKHLIYITGWSVYTEIRLIRDPERQLPGSSGVTLGEILKRKAEEGVRVLMMVWDDRTSIPVVRMDGLMATHDQETLDYFKDTEVKCFLCPRNPDDGLSIVQEIQIGTMFTHHQKTIIVDAPLPGQSNDDSSQRRIVSFVGGIDLCDGRYDNQYHSLFRTLDTFHGDDFHQPNYEGASVKKGGPREPWHDIHSKVEGPIAWDVLHNFEQRWLQQAPEKDLLLPIREVGDIEPPAEVTYRDDPATWNVQLFRSIDGGAAANFPNDPEVAAKAGLVSGKDTTIDRSIQDAYIHAIRRAKDFIYIENQYFLGSSFAWDTDSGAGVNHLIARELALKVVNKIEQGERFAVYVVVPMWPEGIPESAQVLAILDWQKKTLDMMYKAIAQALEAKGITDESPRDYLTFFCLGNRETKQDGEYVPPEAPEDGTNYKSAQENRRFMIYVHSKMMIVDDEYIIVGSANINQRSLDGGRDTEIAIGGYQPYHTSHQRPARGEIHGFRMSLWYEHLGRLDNSFLHPSSLECMKKVNELADEYWGMFAGNEVVDLPGHLLSYPIGVSTSGEVTELPGRSKFPDTNASVLGAKSDVFPPILTS